MKIKQILFFLLLMWTVFLYSTSGHAENRTYNLPSGEEVTEEYIDTKLSQKKIIYPKHPQKLTIVEKYSTLTGQKAIAIRSTEENNIITRKYFNMFDELFLVEEEENKVNVRVISKFDASGKLLQVTLDDEVKNSVTVQDGQEKLLEKQFFREGHRFYEKYKNGKLWKVEEIYSSEEGHDFTKVTVGNNLVQLKEYFHNATYDTSITVFYDPLNLQYPIYRDIFRYGVSDLAPHAKYIQESEVYYVEGVEYSRREHEAEKLEETSESKFRPSQITIFLRGKEVFRDVFYYDGDKTVNPQEIVVYEGDRAVKKLQMVYKDGVLIKTLVNWDGKTFLDSEEMGIIKEGAQFSTQKPLLAILDSGFDFNHEKIMPHYWKNPNETLNGSDDDENGFIDDVLGLNMMNSSSLPIDTWEETHGTEMMGICISDNCDADYYSKHPELLEDFSVVGIKGFIGDIVGGDFFGEALRYVRSQGIKVLNMSFGFPMQPWINGLGNIDAREEAFWEGIADLSIDDVKDIEQEIRKALSDPSITISNHKEFAQVALTQLKPQYDMIISGLDKIKAAHDEVLIVAAAGNENDNSEILEPTVPQSSYGADNVIIVAAATQGGKLSPYSNWSVGMVDVAAIADELTLLEPQDRATKRIIFGGTSAASAQVSKLAGILYHLFSKHGFNVAQIKPLMIKTIILKTVTPVESLKGRVKTGGIINPQRAIEVVQKIVKELSPTESLSLEKIERFLK